MTAFAPGTPLAVRGHRKGRVRTAKAVIAVADTTEAIRYWWPAGTVHQITEAMTNPRAEMFPHTTAELHAGSWSLTDGPWIDTDVLATTEPGSWAVIWHMWRQDGGDFLCWYIDLKRPHQRTAVGFDTYDLDLDLVVRPDGRWEWKDEDEFERRFDEGLIEADEVAAVRRAGEAMVERIERRDPPFDGSELDWRPDPAWTAPALPPGWEDAPLR